MNEKNDGRASFGYREVDAGAKAGLVKGVFDSVAPNYDIMNDLMSAGVHRVWKAALIDRLNPQPGELLLDMAGGTGDIADAFVARADTRPRAGDATPARAVISDINSEMLAAGRARRGAPPRGDRITLLCANAENLPLPASCFDAYAIAFGIRNVTHIEKALEEARRVLKTGGRFCCLEFSHLETEGLQKLYDLYSFNVIPRLGAAVAKDRESYQYLVESIRRFPAQDAFAAMIREAGFARVKYENLSAGIVSIHSGWKI
ncbi:MAG: class I SAM-dependent methyltransferase [Parvularculaceae bacterium]|nr:class I SAM-dependent methyltransferase [Parvularculaceae bacterium]